MFTNFTDFLNESRKVNYSIIPNNKLDSQILNFIKTNYTDLFKYIETEEGVKIDIKVPMGFEDANLENLKNQFKQLDLDFKHLFGDYYLGFIFNSHSNGQTASYQFATALVSGLKYVYHITDKSNLESILKNGFKLISADKGNWSNYRAYKNSIFFGYPLPDIVDKMKYTKNKIAIKVDVNNLELFYDSAFTGGDFVSVVSRVYIPSNRIKDYFEIDFDVSKIDKNFANKIYKELEKIAAKNRDVLPDTFLEFFNTNKEFNENGYISKIGYFPNNTYNELFVELKSYISNVYIGFNFVTIKNNIRISNITTIPNSLKDRVNWFYQKH